jgi:dTDP-4-amino-4,6-dideoxygalactose transaminase
LSAFLGLSPDRRIVLTNTGTAALRLAYETIAGPALQGDLAALPSFTFPATAESLCQLGYGLRFVDVDPRTWTIDPASLERALAENRIRLVVTVDAFGNPSDYKALRDVCSAHGVPLIADSAPALGALYKGQPVGVQASAHAFSMSFAKTMTAGGLGGAAVLPADWESDGARNWLRSSQMGELAAVAALDQLDALDDLVARREEVAAVYDACIDPYPGVSRQMVRADDRSAWVHYVLRLDNSYSRDRIAKHLFVLGVESKAYYAPALHLSAWPSWDANGFASADRLRATDSLEGSVLAIPMSSEMTVEDAEGVSFALDQVLRES